MTPLYMEARTAVNTYHILRMSGELQQHVNFSTILELGSVRSRCGWAGLFSLEASPLDTQTAVFSGSSLCVRLMRMGFPQSSVGKESACNAGDPSSIPGSGRSPGEGIGYPLQYSWASLVAQLVKNLPAVQDTWVRSLGWEDPLEKGKATHSSILAWKIP